MNTIQVHLHTILQKQTPQGLVSHVSFQCKNGQSIADLMSILEITYDDDNLLLVANGLITTAEYILKDGDEIHIIPAISGG